MTENQRFGGRPKHPPSVVRSERVATFLTSEESDQLLKFALAERKSVSSVCHDLLAPVLAAKSNTA